MRDPIVVGVDGSAASLHAAEWAGNEAVLRGTPVRVVHVALQWSYHVPLAPQPGRWGPEESEAAEELLQRAANRVRAGHPDVQVATEIVNGGPGETLVAASEAAELLVVGNRGRGGFTELLLGSVSRHVASRASCPVVVVREPHAHRRGEIVVGVTGRPDQDAVLEFAFREAELRGAVLRLLHAWTHPTSTGPGDMLPVVYDVEAVGQEEETLLGEAVAGWRETRPDVRLVSQVVRAHPAKALIEASAEHDLTIVGAQGEGRSLLGLGFIAHAVVHHARGPVVVVRH
ncbi:universal stress protein [Microtetraspora sp. AC03309]|uniref:universal stress protein n=1 Tax=Microtetraspora sp. AC03309 TaxID=2779376 RepID=UPI001E48ECC5|nr:universal stress protein [Microtetraspora sp. AC03309]MCC5581440.1 universal stress protein [Microtetraspora sp. AC03309]